MRQTGNLIMVAPTQEIAAQERLELEIRLRSQAEEEPRERVKFIYSGDPLSMDFPDIEVRAVLQRLADVAGLNLVASDTVRGNITLRLKDVPWDQALDVILKAKGLSRRQTGDVIMVAPTQEIAAQERLELESPRRNPGEAQRNPGRPENAEAQFSPKIRALLAEIADPKTVPPRRLEIGDTLDRLGDPRPGVGLRPDGLPDIYWVEVPGGPFSYQKGETRALPTFWIARYPVTNAQYQAFMDDGGYAESRWWQGLKRPQPQTPTWTQLNRPRTNVNWYEAVAFGRWLDARLGALCGLAPGSIRLPTELEWEKAARGERGRAHPWGDAYRAGFANVDETDTRAGQETAAPRFLEQTTAVGLFPQGHSLYGVADMAGTVWEWCLNKDDAPEQTEPDVSRSMRALRGESWLDHPAHARAVIRTWNRPGFRDVNWGFRLLSSVPIEPVH